MYTILPLKNGELCLTNDLINKEFKEKLEKIHPGKRILYSHGAMIYFLKKEDIPNYIKFDFELLNPFERDMEVYNFKLTCYNGSISYINECQWGPLWEKCRCIKNYIESMEKNDEQMQKTYRMLLNRHIDVDKYAKFERCSSEDCYKALLKIQFEKYRSSKQNLSDSYIGQKMIELIEKRTLINKNLITSGADIEYIFNWLDGKEHEHDMYNLEKRGFIKFIESKEDFLKIGSRYEKCNISFYKILKWNNKPLLSSEEIKRKNEREKQKHIEEEYQIKVLDVVDRYFQNHTQVAPQTKQNIKRTGLWATLGSIFTFGPAVTAASAAYTVMSAPQNQRKLYRDKEREQALWVGGACWQEFLRRHKNDNY